MSQQLYPWRRHWTPLDDTRGVAVRGLFSADLASLRADPSLPPPRTLQHMARVPVLLLRGESGAGKSVALWQEAERLRGAEAKCEWVDAADGQIDLVDLIAKRGRQRSLTILIDGLDVALLRDPNLDAAFRRALAQLDRRTCARIRLTLRAGHSADSLVTLLEKRFSDKFEHLTLAPLRPEDVRIAAESDQIEPDAFMAAVEALRVGPLASRPPTLRMLLGLWANGGRLPTGRAALYRQGCTTLLNETNAGRISGLGGDHPDLVGRLTNVERFSIAARVAALVSFGNFERLSMAPEPELGALAVDAVAEGVEPTAAGDVRITRAAIREVVGCALFRSAGANTYAFAHPSFMQFMAATYVASRLRVGQSLGLLTNSDGIVGANRIDIASWLGGLEPLYFSHFAASDPQVLLRSGIPASEPAQRLELARSLLEHCTDERRSLPELSTTGDLVLVASPGLDDVLAGVLEDQHEPLSRRLFAAQMANDTGCVPYDSCCRVSLNTMEPLELRSSTLAALAADVRAGANAILQLCAIDNPEENLRLSAMTLAMNGLLAAAEVIGRLKPSTHFGPQTFFCQRFLPRIRDEDIPEALNAIVEIACQSDGQQPYDDHLLIAQVLTARCLGRLDDDALREALADFIARIPPREPWLRWSFPLHKRGLPLAATVQRRRELVSAVIRQAPADLAAVRNILEACFLLRNGDLPWTLKKARRALGREDAAAWSTIVVEVARGCGGAPYEHLAAEGLVFQEIRQIADLSLPLPSDFDRWVPPRGWNAHTETFDVTDEAEAQSGELYEEPLARALDDWALLRLQTAGGGRPDVPPTTARAFLTLTEQADRRLVRDSRDLLRVVEESLIRFERRLKGRDPIVRALWDEGENPRPKDENFLSDFIVDHLRRDLVDRGIVADREVQIRPRLASTAGERTDIRVQAFTSAQKGARQMVASLTIEVKGCWNRGLYAAMKSQLVERYMASLDECVGLYLVGWYVCPSWRDRKVAGLVAVATEDSVAVKQKLEQVARNLSNKSRHIAAVLVDAALS